MPYIKVGERLTPSGEKDQAGEFGGNVAISADGSTVAVTAYSNDAVYVYKRVGNNWIEEESFDEYKYPEDIAISSDGNVLVIKGHDRGFDHTYILTRENGVWTESMELDGHSSVAVSGDGNTILIDGHKSIHSQGTSEQWAGAIVYNRSGERWLEDTVLGWPVDDPIDFYHTIGKLAISGDGNTIVVGEIRIINNWGQFNGEINIFKKSNGKWMREAKSLRPSNSSNFEFGKDISISNDGNTIVLGSSGNINGELYIFTRTLGLWTQYGASITGNLNRDKFVTVGSSVGISSDGHDLVTTGSLNGNGWIGEDVILHYSLINGLWKQQREYVFDNDLSLTSYDDIALSGDAQTLVSGTVAALGNSDGYIQFYKKND